MRHFSALAFLTLVYLTQACCQTAGAEEAVKPSASTVTEIPPAPGDGAEAPVKMEFPARVAAGDRFPIVIYMKQTDKPVQLKFDQSLVAKALPWSNRLGGAYVYSVILRKKGDRTVKVLVEKKIVATAPINVH
jgi:hypothetical protein